MLEEKRDWLYNSNAPQLLRRPVCCKARNNKHKQQLKVTFALWDARRNTAQRHQSVSVVYLWTSVFLCLLSSNNNVSKAIIFRNSRYLLRLNSYQIRHAKTAWGNISGYNSCGSGGEMPYLSLLAELFNRQKMVK